MIIVRRNDGAIRLSVMWHWLLFSATVLLGIAAIIVRLASENNGWLRTYDRFSGSAFEFTSWYALWVLVGVVRLSFPSIWKTVSAELWFGIAIGCAIAGLLHTIGDPRWARPERFHDLTTTFLGLLSVIICWFVMAKAISEFNGQPNLQLLCPQCQYDLKGNASGVCPECGNPIPKKIQDRLHHLEALQDLNEPISIRKN